MPEFIDPYIDPKTGILRNLVGATNLQELREAEANNGRMSPHYESLIKKSQGF